MSTTQAWATCAYSIMLHTFAHVAHMHMQKSTTINTRSHCVSRTTLCAYQRAPRPIGWRHRKALRAAQMRSLGLRQAPHAEKARHAATSQRAAAIAAAGRRRPRPVACAPPMSKGRARSAHTPAATTTTRIVHLSWQSCASRCIQTSFAFFSARGRQGERGGSEHTGVSIVVELSRNVELVFRAEHRRDRALAPDTQEKHKRSACGQRGCTLR